jgi:hypothetical protein
MARMSFRLRREESIDGDGGVSCVPSPGLAHGPSQEGQARSRSSRRWSLGAGNTSDITLSGGERAVRGRAETGVMPSMVRADDRAKTPPPASARAIAKNCHHRTHGQRSPRTSYQAAEKPTLFHHDAQLTS